MIFKLLNKYNGHCPKNNSLEFPYDQESSNNLETQNDNE